ncbi:PREDICTED: leucine-rich repeat, immunoglobulin-like domain and transmembrane domain-containing protein 1 [Myotis davidii]|uniref:leucine-rich repeat, immunoglobulin-like domain and transmembrane domain-containing protein 1 n=1 Tax=Myotis davidii TaxID=225400 RepID=UPI000767B118|nr:PREDICTED: leucine-rich repeat, immunoglobulin-like domain and transmembrane domain-containing protein 1 [Myotis davidii]
MRVALGMLWLLALRPPPQAWSSCPPQCSCSLQVLGDGSMARTVVCNDPDMAPLPAAPSLPGRPGLVLGLQDNPWECDCRLHDLVHFLEGGAPHLAFIEAGLRCAGPGNLAGVAFRQLQLSRCQGPELRPGVASVRSPLGSTVLLRCGATGVPEPQMSWRRVSGHPLNGTVHQQVSRDGTSWALLGLPAVSHLDAGDYICQASNFLGASETLTSLVVTEPQASTECSRSPEAPGAGTGEGPEAAAYDRLVARHMPPTPWPAGPGMEEGGPTGPQEARMVTALKVVGDTHQSVTLVWKAPRAGSMALSVLYTVLGQRTMRQVAVPPGRTRVTLRGLLPETKYVACVCGRGLAPRKEQCVVFSPDEVADTEATQRLINVVVASLQPGLCARGRQAGWAVDEYFC